MQDPGRDVRPESPAREHLGLDDDTSIADTLMITPLRALGGDHQDRADEPPLTGHLASTVSGELPHGWDRRCAWCLADRTEGRAAIVQEIRRRWASAGWRTIPAAQAVTRADVTTAEDEASAARSALRDAQVRVEVLTEGLRSLLVVATDTDPVAPASSDSPVSILADQSGQDAATNLHGWMTNPGPVVPFPARPPAVETDTPGVDPADIGHLFRVSPGHEETDSSGAGRETVMRSRLAEIYTARRAAAALAAAVVPDESTHEFGGLAATLEDASGPLVPQSDESTTPEPGTLDGDQ